MGVVQSTSLNKDTDNIRTSAEFGNPGDGTSKWYHWVRLASGGDTATGGTGDAAVTDPTAAGSIVALLKGLLTFLRISAVGVGKAEDAVAASGDTGIMALAIRRSTPTSDAAAGDYHALHVNDNGALRVAGTEPTNVTTTAYATNLVVKATAGKLCGLQGYNSKATAQFIQIHDAASLPADAAVPKIIFTVPGVSNFSLDLGVNGRLFTTGIVVCCSSTGPTKTIGSADIWVDAQFI